MQQYCMIHTHGQFFFLVHVLCLGAQLVCLFTYGYKTVHQCVFPYAPSHMFVLILLHDQLRHNVQNVKLEGTMLTMMWLQILCDEVGDRAVAICS